MLMMNAKRGSGGGEDWQIMNWAPDDLKAHIGFMMRFSGELKQSGNLVGAEGLAGYWIVDVESAQEAYDIAARASAAPGPGGAPMNMPIEVREVMSGPPPID